MSFQAKPFEISDYLNDPETISAYLTDALENDDPRGIAQALGDVARAKGGISQLAQATGIATEDLSRALGESQEPDFAIILKVIHALGFRLSASTMPNEAVAA